MSQFRPEVVPFPFIPLILAIVAIGLLYLIGKWGYDYIVWVWNNRAPVKHRSSKSKKKRVSKKRRESDSEDDSGSSDST